MKNKKIYCYVICDYNDINRYARGNTKLGLIRDYNKFVNKSEKIKISDLDFYSNRTDKTLNVLSGKFDDECKDID